MITIRHEQMRAFEDASWRGFEDRMIERVQTYFPKPAEQLGEAQLRVLARYAVKRANRHQVTLERNIALYLDLMLVLGANFDEDPQISWAAAIVSDFSLPTESDRIDRLHREGWQYGLKIESDFQNSSDKRSNSSLIEAMSAIRHKSTEKLSPSRSEAVTREIMLRLQTLFPAKCGIVGDECLYRLLLQANQKAAKYNVAGEQGLWLLSALMFVLGSGFDTDPQFPWASQVLSQGEKNDNVDVANRLLAEARAALKRWWDVDAATRE